MQGTRVGTGMTGLFKNVLYVQPPSFETVARMVVGTPHGKAYANRGRLFFFLDERKKKKQDAHIESFQACAMPSFATVNKDSDRYSTSSPE